MVILFLFLGTVIGYFIYKRYKEDKEETLQRNATVEQSHRDTMVKLQKEFEQLDQD